jgi:hypothetical protein
MQSAPRSVFRHTEQPTYTSVLGCKTSSTDCASLCGQPLTICKCLRPSLSARNENASSRRQHSLASDCCKRYAPSLRAWFGLCSLLSGALLATSPPCVSDPSKDVCCWCTSPCRGWMDVSDCSILSWCYITLVCSRQGSPLHSRVHKVA